MKGIKVKSRWCPKGCGKQVFYTSWDIRSLTWSYPAYRCRVCGGIFNKEELENV